MQQKEYVIQAMNKNGGYATLQQLYSLVDFSTWGTKTPAASVRRIVQNNDEFFKIQPGLWGLTNYKDEIYKKFKIDTNDKESITIFTHSYIQGIITNIGNIKQYQTYVPAQDKNRNYLEQKLDDIVSLHKIYDFTYPELIKFAKTVDVIWFNERKLPNSFFEVEHTTDFRNSLNKFYELQDYRANFYIVAPKERENQFKDVIASSIFNSIRNITEFISYDTLISQYENALKGAFKWK